jgi:hypothetical protein
MVVGVPVWAGTVAAPAPAAPVAITAPVNTQAAASRPAIFPVLVMFIVVPFIIGTPARSRRGCP